MSRNHQSPGAELRLDELLSRLPAPVNEPTDSEFKQRLERTLDRVRSAQPQAEPALDLLLKTPLPLQPGELEPSDPYGLAGREDGFDELRAPLKSGEHAPVRVAGSAKPSDALTAADAHPLAHPLRWSYWMTGALGTLAAAAAVLLYVRQQSPAPPGTAPDLAAERSSTSAAPVSGAPSNGVVEMAAAAQPSVVATPPQTQNLPIERATVASKPTSLGAPHLAKASAPAEPAAAAQSKPVEPPLVPAAGPSNLADHPSTGALSAALARPKAEAKLCLSRPDPPGSGASTSVRVVFQSNGRVQKVDSLDPRLDSATRGCLERVFGAARLEPFARSTYEVSVSISR